MNNENIWICPAHPLNLEKTIINPYKNKYLWALNAKRKKSFDELNKGDICLFGSLRKNEGLKYMGIVKTKKTINKIEDDWPFKSPSGVYWKYVFTLSIKKINIVPQKARELRGWNEKQSWQTQTKLTVGKNNFIQYLITNYPEYF